MSSISLNDKTYMSVIVSALKQLVGRTFPNPPVASIVVESNNNFTTNNDTTPLDESDTKMVTNYEETTTR